MSRQTSARTWKHVGAYQVLRCALQESLMSYSADPKGNPIVQEFLLPDLSVNRKGRIRTPEDILSDTDQILAMNNERFTVPEIIFHPDFIGWSSLFQY
jgi:hypothetical protein